MTTHPLCHVCAGFDIRAFHEVAISRVRASKPLGFSGRSFPTYKDFPAFYKNNRDLQTLAASAERGCPLCTDMRQQCAKMLPPDICCIIHACRSPLPSHFDEQITLGLSDWSPEADGMPYLTAVQQLPRGAVNNLAIFDVLVAPGCATRGFETLLERAV